MLTLASAHLQWISGALASALSTAPSSLQVDVRIYVTGGNSPSPPRSVAHSKDAPESAVSVDEKDKEAAEGSNPSAEFSTTLGRPDLLKLLRKEVDIATGPVSVDGAFPLRGRWVPVGTDNRTQCPGHRLFRMPSRPSCAPTSLGVQVSCLGGHRSLCTLRLLGCRCI